MTELEMKRNTLVYNLRSHENIFAKPVLHVPAQKAIAIGLLAQLQLTIKSK